ncbi:MAG TPA: DUF692 domain-containing protein [Verrucomicrobiae bacterium]|jgi:hypothetical protein|nr:DUF692 domain-containing protein [Verrucomicrobiae bacterium]
MRLGIGYRRELSAWIDTQPESIQCLEITAEHFFDRGEEGLLRLAQRFPVYVHGLGLSLGTPGPLDQTRLNRFARVAATANAQWVSEHIAFTRTPEVDLGHLNPIPMTEQMLDLMIDHAREVSDRCRRPILLENITSHLRVPGEIPEPEFLNRLCERAGCALLLDVTNLFINSRNHRFDPVDWLRQIKARFIRQLHIVGYAREGERYTDSHGEPVQEELIALAREVVRVAPVESIILERDDDFPSTDGLRSEMEKLERIRTNN